MLPGPLMVQVIVPVVPEAAKVWEPPSATLAELGVTNSGVGGGGGGVLLPPPHAVIPSNKPHTIKNPEIFLMRCSVCVLLFRDTGP